MPIWKDCQCTIEKAKELKLDLIKDHQTKDYIFILVATNFGGVCNKKELNKITNIVDKAYSREMKKKEAKQNGTKKEIDKGTDRPDSK